MTSIAQTSKIDSLRVMLHKEKTDTGRIMLYNKIAREISTSAYVNVYQGEQQYYDTAYYYADSGLVLSQNIDFLKGEIEITRTMGAIYYYAGRHDEAIHYFEESYEKASQLGSAYEKAAAMYNIGYTYRAQEKYIQALEYLNIASSLFQVDDQEWMLDIKRLMSQIYKDISENELSIEYGKDALDIAWSIGDTLSAASISYNLAAPYLALNDTATSIQLYETAIEYFQRIDNYQMEATVLRDYAFNITAKTDPQKTLELLSEASSLYEQINPNNFALAYTYQGISDIYKRSGKKDSTVYYQNKALQKALSSELPSTIAHIYMWVGTDALESGQLDKAERSFLTAQKYNRETGTASVEVQILNKLSDIYLKKGNPEKAFKVKRLSVHLHDSLVSVESKRRLDILQIQYELKEIQEQKELEWQMQAEQQNQSIIRRRKIIVLSLIALALMAILLTKLIANYRQIKKKNSLLQESHEEMLQIQEQLRLSNNELNMYKDYLEDMVQKKTAEQAEKDMQLYSMSNNLSGGFIYRKIISEDGKEHLSYISSNVEKLFGISPELLMNGHRDLFSYLDEGGSEAIKKKEREYAIKLQPFRHEFHLTQNGKSIWLYNHEFPHIDDKKNVVWDGLVIDITKQKEVEQSLNIAKEKAEEADRLKSVFLANMSHEIRTPMNAIMGFIGFVENERLSPDKRKIYISTIHNSVSQLLQLVENIIDISKLEIQQIKIFPAEFELNELMKEIENLFILQLGENTALFFHLDDRHFLKDDTVKNDRTRIRQVLYNLVENAIKYTEKGYIRFGYKETDDPSELLFFVEDTGIGIPEDQQEVIFEYFRQGTEIELKPKYGGTGLGLSISKGLIGQMGGRIWVESKLGEGSTFFFTVKKHLDTQEDR
ncbi:MAG: tetratricopeptide repeat protein [Bacteroidales bacterium]|jgi:PAS domain S-box-containing protein|nr:tetratricopeptide repeat protein [Bacteroidales bacterium]